MTAPEPDRRSPPASDGLGRYTLPDGRSVQFRHLRADDERLIVEAFQSASPATIYHRFFSPLRALSEAELRRYLSLDPLRDACVIGELDLGDRKRIVCGARYVRTTLSDDEAEIAVTVHDAFRRCGLGRRSVEILQCLARQRGIVRFTADVLETNAAMLGLLRQVAPARRIRFASGIAHFDWDLHVGQPG